MKTTKLGAQGPKVSAIGLGSLSMGRSGPFGASQDDEAIRTIHEAMDRGVTLIDTADFYGNGESELLVGRAIAGRRDKVVVSVKFGAMRGPNGQMLGLDCRPSAVKNFAAYSLKRLGIEVIDVYRPARLDPSVPVEDTVGAIADLIKEGYVKYVGLSEVGADTIRRAHAVHPIADVQMEYSIATRTPEDKVFPALRELGIGATLFGVLSRGLLSGSKPSGPKDVRAHLPRFSGEAGKENEALVEKLRAFATKVGRTPAQVCMAWALAKQPTFVPLSGARTPAHLDVLTAADRPLSAEELTELETWLPRGAFKGTRYPEAQMAQLDSER
ncbi:MAG: aldo/keto reductase [Labilithrix sp.]|nr:aldo/keto reductase [Labilithrix sp.]